MLNRAQKTWTNSATSFPCCGSWTTIPESTFQAATGGGSLMIWTDIQLVNGSHGTCQPIVDGKWAGDYGGEPRPGNNGDIYWKEGLQAVGCCGGGWRPWRKTRVYNGVPAGQHTFAMQCATDGGTMTSCDGVSVGGCSWGFLELP